MNRFSQLLCVIAGAATVMAHAQIATPASAGSSSSATPPPWIDLPGDPHPSDKAGDPATSAIPTAVRAKTDAAHARWVNQGGAEFSPHLNYAGGAPTLMLMASAKESPATQSRRLKAIVQSCEYLVADGSFDHAVICVATYDPANRQAMSTRNVLVKRGAFQAAVEKAGKAPDFAAALSSAYRATSAVEQICADLGIQ